MQYLLIFLLGVGLTLLVIFIIDKITSDPRSAREVFNLSKSNVIENLKLKKDAQEKEMTQEIQNRISILKEHKEALESQIKEKENEYEKEELELKEQYLKKQEDLEEVYKQRAINLEQQDSMSRAQRQKEMELEIQKEASNKEQQISKLNSEYKEKTEKIKMDFLAFSEQINLKKEKLDQEIKQYENKQNQIIARFQKDEQIRNEREYYKISISDAAAQDIQKLKNLAIGFNNSNAIYKLIWEVYYKALIESLFKKILGQNSDKGGIYKITDITNEKVYIGRAVKYLDRWRTHAKRGCGIDPIKSLLYDRMIEIGLENFTWEVVEVCSKEQQSEKEKYWINFYHSDSYGYNQNKGG